MDINLSETSPDDFHTQHEWHWLWAERAWSPTMAQWLHGKWHCVGEKEPITAKEMYQRGWRYLGKAIPPPSPYDEPEIPDFGTHEETTKGPYPITLTCKYVAPGVTFSDLIKTFEEGEKEATPMDHLAANPTKWPKVRGISAVLNKILEAIYLKK